MQWPDVAEESTMDWVTATIKALVEATFDAAAKVMEASLIAITEAIEATKMEASIDLNNQDIYTTWIQNSTRLL